MLAADRMTNEELCQLLDKHLHIDARPAFAAAPVEQRSKSTVSVILAPCKSMACKLV